LKVAAKTDSTDSTDSTDLPASGVGDKRTDTIPRSEKAGSGFWKRDIKVR